MIATQSVYERVTDLEKIAGEGIYVALTEYPTQTKDRRIMHKKRRLVRILKDYFPKYHKQWLKFNENHI